MSRLRRQKSAATRASSSGWSRPIANESGRSARPYRSVDTLATMERRGSITAGIRQAGENFRARFATAQLDPLRAPDWSRLEVGSSSRFQTANEPGLRIEGARDVVWRAIRAVGGMGSPAGSCLWHVVGWERSLEEWALEQGWKRPPGQPRDGLGNPDRGARCGRGAFRNGLRLRCPHFLIDKSGSIW